jgi:hypothetical protein
MRERRRREKRETFFNAIYSSISADNAAMMITHCVKIVTVRKHFMIFFLVSCGAP